MVWIGGLVHAMAVVNPGLKVLQDASLRAEVARRLGFRFQPLKWISMGTLAVTGGYLAWPWIAAGALQGALGWRLGLKVGLFCLMVGLTLLHQHCLGPRLARGGLEETRRQRTRAVMQWLARLNLALGLVVVALAVHLTR